MFIFVQFVKKIGMQLKTFIGMGPHFCNSVNKFFTRIETSVRYPVFILFFFSCLMLHDRNLCKKCC